MRVSTESAYRRVLMGLQGNLSGLVRSQEQVASGLRILRPSDDPSGTARVLSLGRQLADSDRIRLGISNGIAFVDAAAAALEEGSKLLAEVRSLMLQGMNGTMTSEDRAAIGKQVELLRAQLVEIANQRTADRYLFGGTQTTKAPWSVDATGQVAYLGNSERQEIRIGSGVTVPINVAGNEIFARSQPGGLAFAGLVGLQAGTTASQGQGSSWVEVRQDSLDIGALAALGVSVADSGDVVGNAALVIDSAANTIRLGDGPVLDLPAAGSAALANVTVKTAQGASLVLDLSAYSGGDYSGTVSATASLRIGSGAFMPLDPTETDLRLEDPETASVMHVDLTGVHRAGRELVQFSGQIDLFQVLEGIAYDLTNEEGLAQGDLLGRLNLQLEELDRHQGNMLSSLGVLGARSARMSNTSSRFEAVGLQMSSLISETRDADFTKVVLEMQRASSTLELAQATGVRLIQRNLLDFLR